MEAIELIGTEFNFKGKLHIIKNIERTCIVAKPKDEPNGPLKLLLPIDKFNELTGLNVIAPVFILQTHEEQVAKDLIRQVENIHYNNGKNGRQIIDNAIADGYNKIISIKQGAVNKYYLDNEKSGFQLLVSGVMRKYAEMCLNLTKDKNPIGEVPAMANGGSLTVVASKEVVTDSERQGKPVRS